MNLCTWKKIYKNKQTSIILCTCKLNSLWSCLGVINNQPSVIKFPIHKIHTKHFSRPVLHLQKFDLITIPQLFFFFFFFFCAITSGTNHVTFNSFYRDRRTDWKTLSGMSLLMQLFLRKVATGYKSIQKQVSNYILIILPISERTVLWTKYIKSFVEQFLASLESCSNYCSRNLVISFGFYNLDDIGEYLFTHFKVKLVW